MKAFAKILNQTDAYSAHLATAWQNFRVAKTEWKKNKPRKNIPNQAKN
jgi:hypothetical protein